MRPMHSYNSGAAARQWQPCNATTAQARRRLQGGGVTAVVITVHNALASTIDCLEALVATAEAACTESRIVWTTRRFDDGVADHVESTGPAGRCCCINKSFLLFVSSQRGLRAVLHAEDVDAVAL